MLLNGIGAIATGATTLIVAAAKFVDGAWVTILLIAGAIAMMLAIRRHYDSVVKEVSTTSPAAFESLESPVVIVPVEEWNRVAKKAVRFAMTLSSDVQVLHVDSGESENLLARHWNEWVVEPAEKAGCKPPQLAVVKSPYRLVVGPNGRYVFDVEKKHPDRHVAVVVSDLVEKHWYHYLLHNQRGQVLTAMLTLGGDRRIAVVNVPWYLSA